MHARVPVTFPATCRLASQDASEKSSLGRVQRRLSPSWAPAARARGGGRRARSPRRAPGRTWAGSGPRTCRDGEGRGAVGEEAVGRAPCPRRVRDASSYGFGRLIWMPPTRMSFPVPNLVLTMRSSFSLMQSYATSVAALIGSSHDLQYWAFGPAEQREGRRGVRRARWWWKRRPGRVPYRCTGGATTAACRPCRRASRWCRSTGCTPRSPRRTTSSSPSGRCGGTCPPRRPQ